MSKRNDKVPMAILSCFLIAFILQGVLKISGVFVFEKALAWEIFKVIDSHTWLNVIYQILINIVAVYCPSFALTTRPYSNKWYHYVLIFIISSVLTTIRTLFETPIYLEYIFDIVLYVIVPIIINVTSRKEHTLLNRSNLTSIVSLIAVQILLYLCYLGLCYWSSLLSSFIITSQITIYASAYFLIFFEIYIGLVLMMLSLNITITRIKKGEIYHD